MKEYSPERNKKAYLCNGKVKGCKKTYCYLNGGECRHTYDRRYRRNKFLNIFDDIGMEIEIMVDKSVLMICRSIDNLAKEVRDLKRILLRKSDLVIDGKKMKGLEDDGLEDNLK